MGTLDSITSPRDLRALDEAQLDALATEIRDFLITTCARTGGHIGPNLGVVELTMALHRVFDSPRDRIVFDTGHQAYVHKLLTGRKAGFERLRQEGGVSGYPSQAESAHDIVENSHASTALSYADGLAKAYTIRGEDRHVVAVIGDGALTGGMAWEALNNIAVADRSRLVIVVNDNGRSYTPTVGGLATSLTRLRTNPRYENVLDMVKRRLNAVPGVGPAAYDALHAMKKGVKDALAPQGLFEDLGLKYVGPVDGHDRAAMEQTLIQAKRFNGPVIVHALTRKGYGYDPAERHEADQFHGPGPFDVQTGAEKPKGRIWTDHFSDAMVEIGQRRPDVVAITAAMMHPVGLDKIQARYPDRPIDGHDEPALEKALRRARDFGGPAIVHVITQKGKGYAPAENHDADQFHAPGPFDVATGEAKPGSKALKWTSVFADTMVEIGAEREDVVAITAAMLHPTGLNKFADAHPDRIFDVGIAEQHAATAATGMAMNGLHPVVAVYATFLNRCFDQVLMDAALHRQGVTFCLDRAGVTGNDGASHNGMWDMSILQVVPGLRLAAPRDAARLRALLREAVAVEDAPTVVRYPKGAVAEDLPALGKVGSMDLLRRAADGGHSEDLLIVGAGTMAHVACEVADRMADQGIGVTVVDPLWVKPLDEALVAEAARHSVVAVVEDNGRNGGVGDAVARLLRDHDVDVPVRTFGIAQEFLDHAKRDTILQAQGLTPQELSRKLTETVSRRTEGAADPALADETA